MLGGARGDVEQAVELAETLAPKAVGGGAGKGAEDHRGAEAAHEEHRDITLVESV